jgi:hypothetical protein
MRSDAAEQVIDGKLTRLLADGTWMPMATVHFVAVTAVLLVGWMTWRDRLEPMSYGQALCRARRVIPNNFSELKQQDRALTLNTWSDRRKSERQSTRLEPDASCNRGYESSVKR